MQAIYDLLSDTQSLSGVSTAGDVGLLKRSGDLFLFLDGFRTHLLSAFESGEWGSFKYGPTFPPQMANNECPFLRGIRRRVFGVDGKILTDPDPHAAGWLYQVGSFLEKYGSGSISEEMQQAALTSFKEDEEAIAGLKLEGQIELIDLARELIERHILRYLEFKEVPRHGPGAVSEGYKGPGQKYRFVLTPELGIYWPEVHPDNNVKQNFIAAATEQSGKQSRLCFVPKNRRKCRIICAEPSLLQYLQQGLRRPLYRALEASPIDIDLRDQAANGAAAMVGSEFGYYATLDLKSASDRLSLQLVGALFPTPLFARMVACRSTSTVDPKGSVYDLQKFGSMGNALTFPVQTIVFWSLICAQRMLCGDRESEATADTWVYGDDIICPTRHAAAVIMALESCGLKVNRDKSFMRGPFRESCGVHAFNGINITPAYLRTRASNPEGLFSVLATARQLSSKGYHLTAESLYKSIELYLRKGLPYTRRDDCLSRWVDEYVTDSELVALNRRQNLVVDGYQRLCVKAPVLRPKEKTYVSFDNTWDMWDFVGPKASLNDRDRGVIAGGIRLAHAAVPLLV